MKILYIILLASIVLITGCATPAEIRQHTPDYEHRSSKGAKQVAICIADKWEQSPFGRQPVMMRETQEGYNVIISNGLITNLMVDIANLPNNGSTTKYYIIGIGWDAWTKDVADCQ